MHKSTCNCAQCQAARDRAFPVERFEAGFGSGELLSEAEEMELAMELLSVSNEDEMEQFLGKLFRGIGRGLKKFGRVLKPFGRALKGIAKKALPFIGGALGSFIPIPGVGTAIGSAVGGAVSKALEMEFGELPSEESELEIARRIVRIAATAARMGERSADGAPPDAVVRDALLAAARRHVPAFAEYEHELLAQAQAEAEGDFSGEYEAEPETEYPGEAYEGEDETGATTGRWVRRGSRIVLLGA